MTRRLAGLLAAALLTVPGHAQSPAPDVKTASISASPQTFPVGSLCLLVVSVTFSGTPYWSEIDLAPLSPLFEVRHVTAGGNTGARRQWTIEVTSFAEGKAFVPPLAINGQLGNDPARVLARTPPFEVVMTLPEVSAGDPLRPMAGRLDPPPLPLWIRLVLYGGGGAAFVVLALAGTRAVVKRTTERRADRRFWQTTLDDLRALSTGARHATPEARRPLLHRAAALIRSALGRAIDPRVEGRSAGDIRAILDQHPQQRPLRERSGNLFDTLDRERFSRTPTRSGDGEVIDDALGLVNSLPRRPPRPPQDPKR